MAAHFEQLSAHRTLIQIDLRGHGLSDREIADRTLAAQVTDVVAVLDAAEVSIADLMAEAHRASTAIRFAVAHPARVRRMILRGPIIWPAPGQPPPGPMEIVRSNFRFWLEINAQRLSVGKAAWEVDELVKFFARCVEQEHMLAEVGSNDYYDIGLAASVRCPVRVECRPNVGFSQLEAFARYASAFPHGELVVLPGGAVAPMFGGDSTELQHSWDEFLGGGEPEAAIDLSPRESEVVALLASGDSNAEIAGKLALSVRTVERHLTNIYGKIGARGRGDAVAWAVRHLDR
jgi:DNA-binding CsgD family transcriptional regulator/pimeloyl-ACP methyl ester carboxylesterase